LVIIAKKMLFMRKLLIIPLVLVIVLSSSFKNIALPVYKNPTKPLEERVDSLLKLMTLEEKVVMVCGVNTFETQPNLRLGIPVFKMTDGPLGVKENHPTAFPAGVCTAATWDTLLMQKVGEAIGLEALNCGKNVVLGPTVNIHRLPGGGRNFESFSEDPYLASRMAVAYIKGIQSKDVVATVKHFACNNQEYDRLSISSTLDERTLNEIYLPAFKAAVQEANCYAVMGAYNKVNGYHACSNYSLLTEILKNKWGFKGFVMSDWGAVHGCAPYLSAGLDIEMPGGEYMKKDSVMKAINNGTLKVETINESVRRLLRVMFTIGLFDKPYPTKVTVDTIAHNKIAYKAATEGMVLLKNNNHVLPIRNDKIKSIALIGPNATMSVIKGGGSSGVPASGTISTLDAFNKSLGAKTKIAYAQGCYMDDRLCETVPSENLKPLNGKPGEKGLTGEYFNNVSFEGNPLLTRTDKKIEFSWDHASNDMPGSNEEFFSVRWSGYLVPQKTGNYMLSIQSDDGSKLYINNKLIVDNWSIQGMRSKFTIIPLEAGKEYPIKIDYFENTGYAGMRFGWYLLGVNDLEKQAVELAKKSDMAVVFAGLSSDFESEGWDYASLQMPAGQTELINAVSAVNKNTVVVLTGGVGLDMNNWINNVPAILQAWYPGKASGFSICDVLTGKVNPSGKLPVTFVKKWEDSPAYRTYPGTDGKVNYQEGIYVGYRFFDKKQLEPMFPFGFGLSYTTFSYADLKLDKNEMAYDGSVNLTMKIKNTGKVDGAEVIQLYIQPESPNIDRPVKELKHFAKVFLKAGEEKMVIFTLTASDVGMYDVTRHEWIKPAGKYKVLVGSSSRDIKLTSDFVVK
jgi:beta-glucosidase